MINYLLGETIRYRNGVTHIGIKTGELLTSVQTSSIRKDGESYRTSITIASNHASFVEFGTGFHGELGNHQRIQTRNAMHFKDYAGDHFFYSIAGQYPKPFMRTAIMNLEDREDLTDGYEIFLKIDFPRKSRFEKVIWGNIDS